MPTTLVSLRGLHERLTKNLPANLDTWDVQRIAEVMDEVAKADMFDETLMHAMTEKVVKRFSE